MITPRASTVVLVSLATALFTACGDDAKPKTDAPSSSASSSTNSTISTTADSSSSDPTSPPTTIAKPVLSDARVALTRWATGLDRPVALIARPGVEEMYVAEQHAGTVRIIAADGTVDTATALDIGDQISTGNEQGLLGIAFSADGSLLYVDYTDTDGHTRVVEYTMADNGAAEPGSRRELLQIEQPYPNHNGGGLVLGPDGLLYIALGDGGAGGDPEANAQNLSSLLGKLLRIDPTSVGDRPYTVPADNPFVDTADARPEIWQYGLRNPWRFSFDRETDDLWIGDVGQNEWEEVDVLAAGESGANFGWDLREGTHEFEGAAPVGAIEPVFEGGHTDGFISLTGGYVYRGTAIPNLVGAYLFADFGRDDVFAITQQDGTLVDQRELGVTVAEVSSFGEDNAGEIYVVSLQGNIDRIVAA